MIPTGKGKINISETALLHLKNFLNEDVDQHTMGFTKDEIKILHIHSLHEVILKGELRYYGILGNFKDYTKTHNSSGDFYGDGFKRWEYPGSINIKKESVNIFLRNCKIDNIIYELKTKV